MRVRELLQEKSTSLDLDLSKVVSEKDRFIELVTAYHDARQKEELAFRSRLKRPDTWRARRDQLATNIAIADREFVRHFAQRNHLSFTLADFDTSDPERLWLTFTAT
jgi:hypothetical protein